MKTPLILYFSVYGSSKALAKEIARQTGGDLCEIVPEIPYDADRGHYAALAKYAKEEHDRDARPTIKNELPIDDYDTIFLGYPMWWYTFPMIVYTLFDEYNFKGKTLIPFNTHMGSRDGGTYKTVKKLAKSAKVLPGLPVEMTDAEKGASQAVRNWLGSLKLQ